MNPSGPDRTQAALSAALLATWLLAAASTPVGAAPDPRRLTREISVMEKTIDEMLLDSTNLLVYTATNTARGLYLDDYGVIFTFPVSLVERSGDASEYHFKDYKIEDKGDQIIIRRQKPGETGHEGLPTDSSRTRQEKTAARQARQAQQYEAGRREMIDVLLDYGAALTVLRDNQRIAIAALLRDSEYFKERHLGRLCLSVRVADLRAASAGRLSREELAQRVVVEEY